MRSEHRAKIRIIGGELKGRYLSLLPNHQLRPTLGRLRETAFNWLNNKLFNASCLDLFAGSGVWGCEAISRGARLVYFVEKHQSSLAQLQKNLQLLQIPKTKYQLFCGTAQQYLPKFNQRFDLIILDPPYNKKLIIASLAELKELDLIAEHATIYFECAQAEILEISAWAQAHKNYQILKSQKTANIGYGLLNYKSDN